MKILNLGCGAKKIEGADNVDIEKRFSPDIIHDLNLFPYLFEDNKYDLVIMDNSLEHLKYFFSVISEVYRITKPLGTIKIIAPYFRSHWAFIDPTHKFFFTASTFIYFEKDSIVNTRYQYTDVFLKVKKIVFNESLDNKRLFKNLAIKFANKFPFFNEANFSHLFPMEDIKFYLTND
ncbi:methyltransferase domain-containing protein [Candidatus Methylopumilus planktonicus]|uniref:methyltransferase domain-containing protein n=1 Tax=Candidatus Methylopumilus planktonicus TaxID=1581557 RepID=UPI003D187B1F